MRVVRLRTALALDKDGGALAKMLPFFRLGIGGPVAGGRQYLPWIHVDDLVGMYLAALDGARLERPGQRVARPTRPRTRSSRARSGARCTGRRSPPCPRSRSALLYGDMAAIVVNGRRAFPERARELGFTYAHPDLDEALRTALR